MVDPLQTTFAELFVDTAREHADRPALIYEGRHISYGALSEAVGALQAGLMEMGVRPGDRLAMMLPNSPEFAITFFAAQACGAEVVLLNILQAPPEIAYVINDSGARWLVAAGVFEDRLKETIPQCPGLRGIVAAGPVSLPQAATLEALISANAGTPITPAERSPEDVAVLLYTSGTTGRPKGAMLSHRNVIWDAWAANQTLHVGPTDVFMGALPLFHAYGFTVNLTLPTLVGACQVLMQRFAAVRCLELIEAHRATVLAAVPTMFQLMLRARRQPDYDLSSLKVGVSGGAPVPIEVLHEFERRFGTYMLEGYGPTEAAPVVSVNPRYGVRKFGSVGPPLPGIEVKVVDDNDQTLPVGEVGELCVRGPNVMLGYWNAPELTAQAIRDGWLHTGDLARLDEDNYIYIVDRKKDLIIVGGLNVYPREVEDVIYELPQVAEAAVVGVPHSIKGEDVVAYVAFKEGQHLNPEHILDHCRRHLAPFKVPREIVIVNELPKSLIGKILRSEVRKMARERFGGAS
ncbi:MAG: long-chain fatty acid--CoA ligase [Armatimonadetes bacterium]|nr:long-chain fatty acid--CoA ligase [Armatimonadota bacterium]